MGHRHKHGKHDGLMVKRITFTSITPLPPGMTRQTALSFLHNHQAMIDLNPLVTSRHPIAPPSHAETEELSCAWYSITDRIHYVPGVASGSVAYTCAFHDLPWGLQTHCHAPMGLDIRDKWSVGGSEPGEPPQPQELGIGAPLTGLYLREDVDFRCSILMAAFVKKTLKKAHASLVETLAAQAQEQGGGGAPGKMMAREEQDSGPWQLQGAELQGSEAKELGGNPTFVSGGENQGQQPGQVGSDQRDQYQVPPGVYEADADGAGRWRGQTTHQVPGMFEAPGAETYGTPTSQAW